MPQPLYTFLEEYDFSGKTIIPFCPHGGSGFSRTESTIAAMQPDAVFSSNGYTVSRNNVVNSEENVIACANSLGLGNEQAIEEKCRVKKDLREKQYDVEKRFPFPDIRFVSVSPCRMQCTAGRTARKKRNQLICNGNVYSHDGLW